MATTISDEPRGEEPQRSLAARATPETKLEAVVLPVSDVDRAKRFYERLGWRLDADFVGDGWRAVQFTLGERAVPLRGDTRTDAPRTRSGAWLLPLLRDLQ